MSDWIDEIKFNEQGLVCVIAVDAQSGAVLMQAWANADALRQTIQLGEMVYYSRSRQALWHKGETSGHTQTLKELWLDCDGDSILALVHQKGGIACHTGRHDCFYRLLEGDKWQTVEPIIKSPEEIYGKT